MRESALLDTPFPMAPVEEGGLSSSATIAQIIYVKEVPGPRQSMRVAAIQAQAGQGMSRGSPSMLGDGGRGAGVEPGQPDPPLCHFPFVTGIRQILKTI